ncbi:MAG: hypothetical protein QUS33_14080 [Dehalococcoidia bacterium]|nr:hypothetical protein [Dehalococcoidia bacterium]
MAYKCPECGSSPMRVRWIKKPRGGLQLYEYLLAEVIYCPVCGYERETGVRKDPR